jgi:hypothetical protein
LALAFDDLEKRAFVMDDYPGDPALFVAAAVGRQEGGDLVVGQLAGRCADVDQLDHGGLSQASMGIVGATVGRGNGLSRFEAIIFTRLGGMKRFVPRTPALPRGAALVRRVGRRAKKKPSPRREGFDRSVVREALI